MKISVVMPVYNGEEHLEGAIRSVLDQNLRPVDLIVVDDGSSDRSARVVSRFEQSVRLIRQTNQGVSASRNRGVEESRGDWVAFLDQDDVWYPDKLEVQAAYIGANPGCRFVFSDVDIIDAQGEVIYHRGLRAMDNGWIRPFIGGHLHPYPSTILMEKRLFVELGGFSTDFSANTHEDVEFYARLCRVAEMHFLDEVLVQYRDDLFQFPQRYSQEHGDLPLAALEEYYRRFLEKNDRKCKLQNAVVLHRKLRQLFRDEPALRKELRDVLRLEAKRQGYMGKIHAYFGDEAEARANFYHSWVLSKRFRYFRRYLLSRIPLRVARNANKSKYLQ